MRACDISGLQEISLHNPYIEKPRITWPAVFIYLVCHGVVHFLPGSMRLFDGFWRLIANLSVGFFLINTSRAWVDARQRWPIFGVLNCIGRFQQNMSNDSVQPCRNHPALVVGKVRDDFFRLRVVQTIQTIGLNLVMVMLVPKPVKDKVIHSPTMSPPKSFQRVISLVIVLSRL